MYFVYLRLAICVIRDSRNFDNCKKIEKSRIICIITNYIQKSLNRSFSGSILSLNRSIDMIVVIKHEKVTIYNDPVSGMQDLSK